jgi:hypothetical protein
LISLLIAALSAKQVASLELPVQQVKKCVLLVVAVVLVILVPLCVCVCVCVCIYQFDLMEQMRVD